MEFAMRLTSKIVFRVLNILVITTYVFFRIYNSLLVTPFFDNYDSPQYFKFSIFPSFRMQGITFFYSLIQNENGIVIFQTLIGIIVTIYLWSIINSTIHYNLLKFIFTILFFYFASTTVIVEHDASLLSESLSLSSAIFLFASTANYLLIKKNNKNIILLIFALIWFSSTKSSNAIISPVILLILILVVVRTFRKNLGVIISLVICGVTVFLFFSTALSSNVTKTLTTSGTINNRIWIDEKWREELLISGYPNNSHEIWLAHTKENLGSPADQAVVDLPDFKSWWKQGGENFLLKFLFNNPDYAIFGPIALPLLNSEYNYKKTLLSGWSQGTDLTYDYEGFVNSKAPRTILWPDEPEKAYLTLGIIFISLGIFIMSFRFKSNSDLFLVLLTIFTIIIWSYPNWWFGSKPADMARHNLIAAVMWRTLFIVSFVRFLNIFRFKTLVNPNKSRENI